MYRRAYVDSLFLMQISPKVVAFLLAEEFSIHNIHFALLGIYLLFILICLPPFLFTKLADNKRRSQSP